MGRQREFDPDEALDAALALFWQKGYEGTSFEDLTRATGVARPGLYAAFGNKEALFRKALDRYDAKYLTYMREALEQPSSYEVVRRIMRGSAEVQTLDPAHPGCLGTTGALACSLQAEPIRLELARRRQHAEAALCRRLERARDEGDLPRSTDCATLAAFVMAVTQGMVVQATAGASRARLEAIADHALAAWPRSD